MQKKPEFPKMLFLRNVPNLSEKLYLKTKITVPLKGWPNMLEIRELLKYNEGVRRKYFDSFLKLSWSEFTKNREASFHSIRNIFVHIVGTIDYFLDFLQKEDLRIKKEFDDYKNFQEVKAYMEHVEKRLDDYLSSLSPEELNKTYAITAGHGETFAVTAEDVLFHVFEEDIYHRGELNALLWQIGIDPPLPTIEEYLQYAHPHQ